MTGYQIKIGNIYDLIEESEPRFYKHKRQARDLLAALEADAARWRQLVALLERCEKEDLELSVHWAGKTRWTAAILVGEYVHADTPLAALTALLDAMEATP